MPNEAIQYDADGYVRFEDGWLEKAMRQFRLELARQARRQWLDAPEWAREQVLREENDAGND